MPDYSKLQDTALRLIQQSGQKIAFTRTTRGGYDPVEGEATGEPTVQTGEFDAVVLPASKGTLEAFDFRLADGLRLDQVRFLIVAAKGAPFQLVGTDKASFEGKTWTVMGCTPLNPAGTPLIYKVGMKLT